MIADHHTKVVPHDHVNCHTSRVWPAANGDCGTRFETHCSCGFGQGASCREQAEAIARGHCADPDAPCIAWDPTPMTADAITDADLRSLFERHCECRPLDLSRGEDDHAAIHDCDTAILHDVQIALGVRFADRTNDPDAARARCAEHVNADREVR